MPLSTVDRGVLERFIDDMKKGQAVGFYKAYKQRGATKEHVLWFCKGELYGLFAEYYAMMHKRAPEGSNASEISEAIDVIERRTNEIADVLTEYDD